MLIPYRNAVANHGKSLITHLGLVNVAGEEIPGHVAGTGTISTSTDGEVNLINGSAADFTIQNQVGDHIYASDKQFIGVVTGINDDDTMVVQDGSFVNAQPATAAWFYRRPGGYARLPVTWATNPVNGLIKPNANLLFSIPAGPTVAGYRGYAHISRDTDIVGGPADYGGHDFPVTYPFGVVGQVNLLAATTGIYHHDPALTNIITAGSNFNGGANQTNIFLTAGVGNYATAQVGHYVMIWSRVSNSAQFFQIAAIADGGLILAVANDITTFFQENDPLDVTTMEG